MIVTVNRKSQLTVCATSSGTVQGDDIDWREGSSGHTGVLYGGAPDHASALRCIRRAVDVLNIGYS
jgi:hypothetical protein